MDETEVDGRGQVRKILCASGSSSTGFKSNPYYINGPILTCFVTTSRAGHKLPPFFIIAGKMVIKRWWNPLRRRADRTETNSENIPEYFKPDWMPESAGIALSENCSITKVIFPAYIQHQVKNAPQYSTDEKIVTNPGWESIGYKMQWNTMLRWCDHQQTLLILSSQMIEILIS